MFKKVIGATCLLLALPALAATTANDGDWTAKTLTLANTPEARLMVRVGDINNLGFGWPTGFDPFSGNSTPSHGYPWTANASEPAGTDRIMVITSYAGNPPHGSDGYTGGTSRPDNAVRSITLTYDLTGITVQAATLQMFVDDFQAPVWGAKYQVKFNDQRIGELETIINSLDQTGPIGKLITFNIPANYLSLLKSGSLAINIDDPTSGAGDGYAIDFVKLLINPTATVGQSGGITGTVTDAASGKPLANVAVLVNNDFQAVTDATGKYTVSAVVSGLAVVQGMKSGYTSSTATVDVITQKTSTVNLALNQSTGTTPTLGACSADTSQPQSFTSGWNLAGNGIGTTTNVIATFGDAAKVVSVWTWVASSAKWAFYAPSLAGQALTDYATGHGYNVLSTINGGEGFWVNAKQPFSVTVPAR